MHEQNLPFSAWQLQLKKISIEIIAVFFVNILLSHLPDKGQACLFGTRSVPQLWHLSIIWVAQVKWHGEWDYTQFWSFVYFTKMIDLSLPPSLSSNWVIVSAGAWIVSEMTYNINQHRHVEYLLTKNPNKMYARTKVLPPNFIWWFLMTNSQYTLVQRTKPNTFLQWLSVSLL